MAAVDEYTISDTILIGYGKAQTPTVILKEIYGVHSNAINSLTKEKAASILISGKKIRDDMKKARKAVKLAGFTVYVPKYPLGELDLNQNRMNACVMVKAVVEGWAIETSIFKLIPNEVQNYIRPYTQLVTSGVQFVARLFIDGKKNSAGATSIEKVFSDKLGNHGMGTIWVCACAVDWVAHSVKQEKEGNPKLSFGNFCQEIIGQEKGTSNGLLANTAAQRPEDLGMGKDDVEYIKRVWKATGHVTRSNSGGSKVIGFNDMIMSSSFD